MPKRKPNFSPSVKFAVFDGGKKLTQKHLAEVQAFVEYVEKQEKDIPPLSNSPSSTATEPTSSQ